jgi:hypothetical protein
MRRPGISGSGQGAPFPAASALFRGGGVKKGPGDPISLLSADLRWPRGQPPMSHPAPHAGPVPAPPVSSGPAGTGDQQPATAAGPGIGVPVSVWPAPGPVPGPGPEAAYIITAFSRPGELVVIPAAGTGALLAAAAAAAAGRRVLGLFSGPAACHAASARLDRDLGPAARPLAQARAGGPALLLEAGSPEAGQAALAVLGRGDPGGRVLYTACERVLRPGGVLAVITASTPRPAGLRDDPGEVIAAARAAGLVYAQHIVALHAAITDGQLVPVSPGAGCPDETPGPPAVCARIHSDLLVFTKPGTPASSAGLKGSQPEPEGPMR